MPSPLLAALEAEVSRATTIQASAVLLIRGIAVRVQQAVQAAVANGATEAELAPVQDEVNALRTSSDDLTAAVSENTPAA